MDKQLELIRIYDELRNRLADMALNSLIKKDGSINLHPKIAKKWIKDMDKNLKDLKVLVYG